jgi:hypothetical protein
MEAVAMYGDGCEGRWAGEADRVCRRLPAAPATWHYDERRSIVATEISGLGPLSVCVNMQSKGWLDKEGVLSDVDFGVRHDARVLF